MIPEDRDELYALAGEYVLGVLEPEPARDVEAALATNAELRAAVVFWEERLHPLSVLARPEEPSAGTWDAIAARIGGPTAPAAKSPVWNSVVLWRRATAAATALAASLALYIALAPPAGGPSFVAVLHAPQQEQAAWIATGGGHGLLVRAVAGDAAPIDRSFELWAIPPGSRRPQSLGVIPPEGRLELGTLPRAVGDGGTLAITIEPRGGSPTGQPTGPIVYVGSLVRAQ